MSKAKEFEKRRLASIVNEWCERIEHNGVDNTHGAAFRVLADALDSSHAITREIVRCVEEVKQ